MNYSEECIKNPDFLSPGLSGTWSREASRDSMQSILQQLRSSGHRLLLIDDTDLESSGEVSLDY